MDRRQFLVTTACATVSAVVAADDNRPMRQPYDVILWDGFAIFDPKPIADKVAELFPAQAPTFVQAFRARQIDYAMLRALAERYENFDYVTLQALRFAANAADVRLGGAHEEALLEIAAALPAYPDVRPALEAWKRQGIRQALLANWTRATLERSIAHAGLDDLFDAAISTDDAKTYKPAPRAYRLAVRRMAIHPNRALFVASAGWDAAGSRWFGYPTFWLRRTKMPVEVLGVDLDGEGADLVDLTDFLEDRARAMLSAPCAG